MYNTKWLKKVILTLLLFILFYNQGICQRQRIQFKKGFLKEQNAIIGLVVEEGKKELINLRITVMMNEFNLEYTTAGKEPKRVLFHGTVYYTQTNDLFMYYDISINNNPKSIPNDELPRFDFNYRSSALLKPGIPLEVMADPCKKVKLIYKKQPNEEHKETSHAK